MKHTLTRTPHASSCCAPSNLLEGAHLVAFFLRVDGRYKWNLSNSYVFSCRRFLEPKKAWIKKLPLFVPEDRFSERWETIVMIPLTYEVRCRFSSNPQVQPRPNTKV